MLTKVSIPTIRKFSKFIGTILYYLMSKRTKVAYYNINKILPNLEKNEQKKIIIYSYSKLVSNFLELLKIQKMPLEKIKKIVTIENIDLVNQLFNDKKGIICILGHFGNWEILSCFPIFTSNEVFALAKKQSPQWLNDYLKKSREKFGMKILYSRNSVLSLLKALKRNAILGLIVDQRTRKKGSVQINFFGENIYASTAPVYLSLKTGAPILFAYSLPTQNGHKLIFSKINLITNNDSFENLLQKNTQLIHDIIAEKIKENPENWFWLHSKFKSKRRTLLEVENVKIRKLY